MTLVPQIEEEEDEEKLLSRAGCFLWLAVVTLWISILSDYIMDAITGVCIELAQLFIAVVVQVAAD
jgi:hypothetical protein